MSGVSTVTALQIYYHPRDLQIILTKDLRTNKFCFIINHGPSHSFKMLLDYLTANVEDTREMVLGELKNLFTAIHEKLKCENEEDGVLGPTAIAKIIEELRTEEVVSTWQLLAVA